MATRRRSRAPARVPPRVVGSPTLLTGLLKCGSCGAGMTLATGKGGRYRYYKCNTRIGKGRTLCTARSIPMDKLDAMVLQALADRVFVPTRVHRMLADLRSKFKAGRASEADQVRILKHELDGIGVLPRTGHGGKNTRDSPPLSPVCTAAARSECRTDPKAMGWPDRR